MPIWSPQPGPQHALTKCEEPLVFFGGARGGGKTDGVLGKWAAKEQAYGRAFNAVMFRRTTVSSEDAIDRSRQIFGPLGGRFNASALTWKLPHGGRLAFKYLDKIADADEWQGRNLSDVWVEEAGQYPTPDPIDRLFGVMRSAGGIPVQMILTANPGGAGQNWLRDRFGLWPFPRRPKVFQVEINEGRVWAAVIPSRLEDNRVLLHHDPGYIERLRMVGSAELVRAWLEGDWSAIEGAFFAEWDEKQHVIEPFDIPADWLRFRSMDWGFAAPFSVGWWAVAGEDHEISATDETRSAGPPDKRMEPEPGSGLRQLRNVGQRGRRLVIPRGALVRYREWYGAKGPQKGLRLTAEEVADGIVTREAFDGEIKYGVLDPSAFAQDGGPSIAERMAKRGARFRKADNKRLGWGIGALGGWDQMRSRLRGMEGRPMVYCFDTCRESIRTIPVLQHDPDKPEDLDTDAEDHAADEWRYACMSRPWIPRKAEPERPRELEYVVGPGGVIQGNMSVRELVEEKVRRRKDEDG